MSGDERRELLQKLHFHLATANVIAKLLRAAGVPVAVGTITAGGQTLLRFDTPVSAQDQVSAAGRPGN